MITGKLTPAVMQRSVQRVLQRAGVYKPEYPAKSRTGIWRQGNSLGTLGGELDRTPDMLLAEAAALVLAGGAVPARFDLSLMLPTACSEEELRSLMEEIARVVSSWEAVVTEVLCQVSDAVNRPVFTAVCLGESPAVRPEETRAVREEMALVMAGTPGLGGTARLCQSRQEALKRRLPGRMISETAGWMERLQLRALRRMIGEPTADTLIRAMQPVAQGGVFEALWDLAARTGLGLELDLRAMPMEQEVVEVCEVLGVHPYRLNGQGAVLLITDQPKELCRRLLEAGENAAVIGHVTAKAVVVHNGEETRYLEKPQQEELDRLVQGAQIRP
ncbi:MAG: AIR synthase-related protein [Lachnospiraceae bacterium]|nr:AIR synthase-related protein [Lachnospiraceae bacterium]